MKWLLPLLVASTATAAPIELKIATSAPEGSAWLRELVNGGREIESASGGQVRLKIYPGSVVGNEHEAFERLRKGQLDGDFSGGPMCQRVMPTMALLRFPGLFENGEEMRFVTNKILPQLEEEARRSGFVITHAANLGPDIFFFRQPVRSMAELRATKMWGWSEEAKAIDFSKAMGMTMVVKPLEEAGRAFDKGEVDGFWALPGAALVFRWSTQAKYFLPDLRVSFLTGCVLFSLPSWNRLTYDQQQLVRGVMAKYERRLDDLERDQDAALLGGLFQKQGLKPLTMDEKFRAEFYASVREMRDHLDEKVFPRAMLDRVQQLLFDYRNEHRKR